MTFGDRVRAQREALGLSRAALAQRLDVTISAIGNYETGISFPKDPVIHRLFDALETDPNNLFRDSYHGDWKEPTHLEWQLLKDYRSLSPLGRESVRSMLDALLACREEAESAVTAGLQEPRVIPLYRTPAAAGYAAPAFGSDFDYINVEGDVPPAAEFAVRIQGDSMAPLIDDGAIVYVNRDPLRSGDVGIFCVDGDIFCKQYHRDPAGIVYLFSLNRERADADIVFSASGGRSLTCLGRVILRRTPPLPGMG